MSLHVEGRKVCAVCARVLDERGGEWVHSIAAFDPDDYDHMPVPVDDTEVQPRERCDFCFGEDPAWIIPAHDFMDAYGFGLHSSGDWAACETCGQYIQRNEWNALLRRVKQSWADRHDPMSAAVEHTLKTQYRRLRKNMKGPIQRIDALAPDELRRD